jgi:hypothetical protein
MAGVSPQSGMMVTANPIFGPYQFGDIEIARATGMLGRLIRSETTPDLLSLAESLGC